MNPQTTTWEALRAKNEACRAEEARQRDERPTKEAKAKAMQWAGRREVSPFEYDSLQAEALRLENLAISLATSLAMADRKHESERLEVEAATKAAKAARETANTVKPFRA